MTNNLTYLTNLIKESQARELDATICLSGFVGEGKSTLALQIVKSYYNITTLKQFKDFCENWMFYERKALKDKIMNNHMKCLVADEAVNMLFKRDFMKGNQKDLLKIMDVCRDHNHLFIFNIPSFWALDGHTVQTRTRLWIYVEKQKYAHIFAPIRNMFARDVWFRDYNMKLFMKHKRFTKSPNYITSISFDPLSAAEYRVYKKVKDEKKFVLEEEKDALDDATKKDIILWIHNHNPNATYKDIASVLKTHYNYVQQVLVPIK